MIDIYSDGEIITFKNFMLKLGMTETTIVQEQYQKSPELTKYLNEFKLTMKRIMADAYDPPKTDVACVNARSVGDFEVSLDHAANLIHNKSTNELLINGGSGWGMEKHMGSQKIDKTLPKIWDGASKYAQILDSIGVDIARCVHFSESAGNTPQEGVMFLKKIIKHNYDIAHAEMSRWPEDDREMHPDQKHILRSQNREILHSSIWSKILLVTVPQQIARVTLGTIEQINSQGIKNLKIYPAFPPNTEWDKIVSGNQDKDTMTRRQNARGEVIRIIEYQLNRKPKNLATFDEYNDYMIQRDGKHGLQELDGKHELLYSTNEQFRTSADVMISTIDDLDGKTLQVAEDYIKNPDENRPPILA